MNNEKTDDETDDPHPTAEMMEAGIGELDDRIETVPPEQIGFIACVAVYTDEAHEDDEGFAWRLINPDVNGWDDPTTIIAAADTFNEHLERAKLQPDRNPFEELSED
jgi:hypothetical protein